MSNVKANTEKPKRDKYTWLLLIGEEGKFIWSLFLPLSALCAISSTPLSFSKRNGPTAGKLVDKNAQLNFGENINSGMLQKLCWIYIFWNLQPIRYTLK